MERAALVLKYQPIRDHPDAGLVTLEGSIDPKSTNRFRDELLGLATKGIKRFFLDCQGLTYINSSGLAALLNLAGIVKQKGGTVALAALDSKILVIFKMMGVLQLFQFYPSFADALRDLDEKLARELRDVGPALVLEEPPPPAPAPVRQGSSGKLLARQASSGKLPARQASSGKLPARRETARIQMRPPVPVPQGNPFVRFLRALFGIEEARPASFSRMSRKRL